MRRKVFISAIIVTAIAFVIVYLFLDPAANRLFPKCPFYMLTDYKCPGCGSQRAIHALLNGEFIEAFKYNALMVVSIPVILLYGYAEIMNKRKPRLYAALCSPTVIWIILAVVIAWWIFRNIFCW